MRSADFDRHDVDRDSALTGIDRQYEAATGDPAVDFDHEASGARIFRVGIGRDRLRQRDIDLADMVARDRLRLLVGERAGIDRLLDRHHGRAGLARAETDQDLLALRQWLVVQPEDPRADAAGIARALPGMADNVAALDEQFAVERDADGAAGGLTALQRRHRPALDRFDLRNLAGGHDDDLVAGLEVT